MAIVIVVVVAIPIKTVSLCSLKHVKREGNDGRTPADIRDRVEMQMPRH